MLKDDLDQLKSNLDIVTVAESYGTLVKTGANYRFKDNKSIMISPSKQIYKDFGAGGVKAGTVLDLIIYMENISLGDAIKKLKGLNGIDTYSITDSKRLQYKETKAKEVDISKISYFAKKELKASSYPKIDNGYYQIDTLFHKLFETKTFSLDYKPRIEYLFDNIIGYSNHFNCPTIIIRDSKNNIVDAIAYRPQKPKNYDNWSEPKYIYKNSHNRGSDFLYPFQNEVQKIIEREKYIVVGEGIKNGLNALLYSVPFISLEGGCFGISDKLYEYIKNYVDKGFGLICMFDGDKAGEIAFNNFVERTKFNTTNYLDFNSNMDFVEYLMGEEV